MADLELTFTVTDNVLGQTREVHAAPVLCLLPYWRRAGNCPGALGTACARPP